MRRSHFVAMLAIAAITCTFLGCTDKNESSNVKSNMQNIYKSIEQQKDNVIKKDFNNLKFSKDFSVEFPDTDSVETFEMTIKPSLSGEEVYKRFDDTVEKYFPGFLTEDEKKELYLVNIDTGDVNQPLVGKFSDYKDQILNGELASPLMFVYNSKLFVQMAPNGNIFSITGSRAFEIQNGEKGKTVAMYCAANDNKITDRIRMPFGSDFSGDDKYRLFDKEVALADAVKFTKKYLTEEFDKGAVNPKLYPDITDTWIVDMGNGIFGYHFLLTSTYNNVRFDYYPMKEAMSFSTVNSEASADYQIYPGHAFMIESEKLDSIMSYGRAYDILEPQKHDEVITFESAVDALSNEMSGVVQLTVNRAEFVYVPKHIEENDNRLDVSACWKFMARNLNDQLNYVIYINAVTGSCEYYKYD